MANHIDFIERIYNNVKFLLILCNKINYLKGNDTENIHWNIKLIKLIHNNYFLRIFLIISFASCGVAPVLIK